MSKRCSSFFDMHNTPQQPHVFLPFFPLLFCFFGDVAFSEYFCTITVSSLYGEYSTSYISPFSMVFKEKSELTHPDLNSEHTPVSGGRCQNV